MFYRHWKRIALTLTAFFWASCHFEDSAQPLYGVYCPPEGCDDLGIESSSDEKSLSSNLGDATASSSSESNAPSSSSILEPGSSENAPTSSGSTEESSTSGIAVEIHRAINWIDGMEVLPDSCEPNREGYNPAYMSPYLTAEVASRTNVYNALNRDSISAESKECLNDVMANLQEPVLAYGVTSHIVLDVKCSDGSTYYSKVTKRLAERYGITEEEVVKKSEALDRAYKEGLQKIEQKINNCLDPNRPTSSSSEDNSSSSDSEIVSSSSVEVTCVPTDSTVEYFAADYSADTKKMWKEEQAKHDAVNKIDSIKSALAVTPMCLENLRHELDMFVALYGAPIIIQNAVESCSDGTIKPSEEYAKFLKMKEEWDANKPALDAELQKVYEDKMKEIEERINKCLSSEAGE